MDLNLNAPYSMETTIVGVNYDGGVVWVSIPEPVQAYQMRNAGAVIHSHGMESCIVTMINPNAKWVSYLNRERKLDSAVGPRPVAPRAPKGLYLYENVGSGKTMLMDMFYSSTEGIIPHRRRYHFHEAMLEINEHMHNLWKKQFEEKSSQSSISSWIMNLPFDTKVKEWLAAEERYKQEVQLKNILPVVADKFLLDRQAGQKGASILCFDEIQTVDVFAIIALSGILSRLLTTGTVLVATSNRAPKDLNQHAVGEGDRRQKKDTTTDQKELCIS